MIPELERIYGIHNGGDRKSEETKSERNNYVLIKTQEELASQLGISVDTLNNYKLLTEMIPELEDLVDTGIVTKTTALAIMRNLSPDEQEELPNNSVITKSQKPNNSVIAK